MCNFYLGEYIYIYILLTMYALSLNKNKDLNENLLVEKVFGWKVKKLGGS